MIKHISYVVLAAQILIGLTSAQDLSKLPQCAEAPSLKSIRTTNCQLTDFACICNDQSYTSSLEPIIKQACSPEDYEKTLQFTQNLCGSVGVTISNNATTRAASTSGSPSSSTSSAVSSSTSSATASGSSIQPASSAASTEVGIGLAMLAMMVVSVLHAMAA